jgi:hypothetical protein
MRFCSPSPPIPSPLAPSFTTGFGSLPNSLQWLDYSPDRLRVDHGLHGVAHWLAALTRRAGRYRLAGRYGLPGRMWRLDVALAARALRIRGGRQGE